MKIQDIYNLAEGLSDLSNKELPISIALKVQRSHTKVVDEVKNADVLRKKLIEKYKESDNDDGTVKIKTNKIEVFQKELDELMEQEVDIKLDDIDVSQLEDISIKPRTLSLISTILKE